MLVVGVYVLLVLVNTTGVVLVVMQLPGTWLILLATVLVAWWRSDDQVIGLLALIVLGILTLLGELFELLTGAWSAHRVGASKLAVMAATGMAVIGAIAGTYLLPMLPAISTLFGAVLGAGFGSILGDRWAGRCWSGSLHAGKGAAIGRLWGGIGKIVVAIAMWLITLGTIMWP